MFVLLLQYLDNSFRAKLHCVNLALFKCCMLGITSISINFKLSYS